MLKNILNLNGAQVLSKKEQQFINGGVEKCCIKIPGQDPPPGCNNNYECRFSHCYCGNQQ